jgi:rhodanese-related sulfurtransferase
MLTATSPISSSNPGVTHAPISPRDAQALLARGGATLVDVREPDEHARERIEGSTLLPLGQVSAERLAALGSSTVLIHCKSGRRGGDAVGRAAELLARGISERNIEGGVEAWRAAGLPTKVDAKRPKLGVMQQTQLVIGACVVAGTALGAFANPWFLILPAFMGAGLLMAGATGFCGLANLIALAPWNRAASSCGTSCNTAPRS